MTAAAATATAFSLVALGELHESPTNPRKTFDQKHLEELAANVAKAGVLHPLLVRPIPTALKSGHAYEIVAGHRRARASALAGLDQVPCFVREMTDLEVVETQLIELSQRDDVHPLEEAESYRVMKESPHSLPEAEIAARVGKTAAYVHQRLKLCALVEPARSAYLKGTLSGAIAQLLARIANPKLQAEAAQEVLEGGGYEYANGKNTTLPMSLNRAMEHLREKYTLQLGGAPFDTKDAELVPGAGPCTTCPKRTGNQVELFPDIKSKDVCTDPTCFAAKKAAAWAKTKAEAKEEGKKVLSKSESEKLFPRWGSRELPSDAPYVDLKAKCEEDPKHRTWGQLLGKSAPEKVLAADRDGKVHDLVDKKAAVEALKEAGHNFAAKVSTASRADSGSYHAQQEREAAERKKREQIAAAVANRVVTQMVGDIERGGFAVVALRLMVGDLSKWGNQPLIRRRLGLPGNVQVTDKQAKEVRELADKMDAQQLLALAFESIVCESFYNEWNDDDLKGAAKAWGFDLKKVRKEVEEDLKAAEDGAYDAAVKKVTNAGAANEDATCAKCMCTEDNACEGGCSWVPDATIDGEPVDLCTRCEGYADKLREPDSGAPAKTTSKKGKPKKAAADDAEGKPACLVPNCGRPCAAKGLCPSHYRKARSLKMGDTFTQAQLEELAQDKRRKGSA